MKLRKMRSDAVWSRLTPDQTALLDQWLLDERPRPGYAAILARVAAQFGVRSSLAALCAYNRHRTQIRLRRDLLQTQMFALDADGRRLGPDQLRHTVLNAAGQTAINLVAEQAGDASQLLSVARVLLSEEEHGLQRRRLDYELARLKKQEARASAAANRSNLPQNAAPVEEICGILKNASAYFRVFQPNRPPQIFSRQNPAAGDKKPS
jgi:hypothetical protein